MIIHDAGKHYAGAEFQKLASGYNIACEEVPIEAHDRVGKIERAYRELRRAYIIFKEFFKAQGLSRDDLLKMSVKACNDSAGPDGLIPTLLVFGVYPRVSWDDNPVPIAQERIDTIRKAMEELRIQRAKNIVNLAKNDRNGPKYLHLANVNIGDQVLVFREPTKSTKGYWEKAELVDNNESTVKVKINGEIKSFRANMVKNWLPKNKDSNDQTETSPSLPNEHNSSAVSDESTGDCSSHEAEKNKSQKLRRSDRLSKAQISSQFTSYSKNSEYDKSHDPNPLQILAENFNDIYMTEDEAIQTSKELREKGLITSPGAPFEQSTKKELDGLAENGIFEFLPWDDSMKNIRIFKSRIVKTVKGLETSSPIEKSRLVVQGYKDQGKSMILTQSPSYKNLVSELYSPSYLRSKNWDLCCF